MPCLLNDNRECDDPMECIHWGREGCGLENVKPVADDLFHYTEHRGSRPNMEDGALPSNELQETVRGMIYALLRKPSAPMGRC